MAIAFKFKSNAKDVNAKMSNMVAVQMPFAISKALNETAKTLVAKNKQDMRMIFDRPVPFTLNAFYFRYAKKGQTSVTIRRKDKQVGRHYLEVQEYGGLRPQTGMEKTFAMNLPYSGILRHITPTKAAPKNKHGNMSPGFRNKMMSAMQVARDPTQRSKTRGKQYFVPSSTHPLGQGKRAGVYMRNSAGNAKKMLNFIDRGIKYKPKLKFGSRMNRYGRMVYPRKFQAAMKLALSTARLR